MHGKPISGVSISLYRDYEKDKREEKPESTEPVPPPESGTSSDGADSGNTGTDEVEDTGYRYYNTDWAYGTSDNNGEYQIELFNGTYWLSAYEQYSYEKGANYYSYSAKVEVGVNTTATYDFSMKPLPPRNWATPKQPSAKATTGI